VGVDVKAHDDPTPRSSADCMAKTQ